MAANPNQGEVNAQDAAFDRQDSQSIFLNKDTNPNWAMDWIMAQDQPWNRGAWSDSDEDFDDFFEGDMANVAKHTSRSSIASSALQNDNCSMNKSTNKKDLGRSLNVDNSFPFEPGPVAADGCGKGKERAATDHSSNSPAVPGGGGLTLTKLSRRVQPTDEATRAAFDIALDALENYIFGVDDTSTINEFIKDQPANKHGHTATTIQNGLLNNCSRDMSTINEFFKQVDEDSPRYLSTKENVLYSLQQANDDSPGYLSTKKNVLYSLIDLSEQYEDNEAQIPRHLHSKHPYLLNMKFGAFHGPLNLHLIVHVKYLLPASMEFKPKLSMPRLCHI